MTVTEIFVQLSNNLAREGFGGTYEITVPKRTHVALQLEFNEKCVYPLESIENHLTLNIGVHKFVFKEQEGA